MGFEATVVQPLMTATDGFPVSIPQVHSLSYEQKFRKRHLVSCKMSAARLLHTAIQMGTNVKMINHDVCKMSHTRRRYDSWSEF